MLKTMFPYGARSSGGNDKDELDDKYGGFGDEYQGIFSGDKNVSFRGDMVFENLESGKDKQGVSTLLEDKRAHS